MKEEERIQKAVQSTSEAFRQLAESQAEVTIGQTVVAMHQQGLLLNTESLMAQLLSQAQAHKPGHLERVQHEAAARLLGWHPGPEGD